jgi:predicted MFS family arabinose efflux permease
VTFTQIGYGLGLLLVVPLADLFENRRLIVTILFVLFLALIGAAFAPSASLFFAVSLLVGLSSVAVQVIVPFAGHLASDATRGRVVGSVTSGLFFGIMLARPAASFVAHSFGWRPLYAFSAAMTAMIAAMLLRVLPQRQPHSGLKYIDILRSLLPLVKTTPILRRRAIYHMALFAAFSLFWTAVPLLLASAPYHLTQVGIGLFSLAGAAGAIAAPLAGNAADKGWTRALTCIALLAVVLSFGIGLFGEKNGSIPLLVIAAIVLDMGVSANLILGQRAIFALGPEIRSRLNGLFMASLFVAGAGGSALAGLTFAKGGWTATSVTGAAFAIAAFLYYLSEPGVIRAGASEKI